MERKIRLPENIVCPWNSEIFGCLLDNLQAFVILCSLLGSLLNQMAGKDSLCSHKESHFDFLKSIYKILQLSIDVSLQNKLKPCF